MKTSLLLSLLTLSLLVPLAARAQVNFDSFENTLSHLADAESSVFDSLLVPIREPAVDVLSATSKRLPLPLKTKELKFVIESAGLFDTNALESPLEQSDWHWDTSILMRAKFVPLGDLGKRVPLEITTAGGIGFARYDDFADAKDVSQVFGNVLLRYRLTKENVFPMITLIAGDKFSWNYHDFFGDQAFFGNEASVGVEWAKKFGPEQRWQTKVVPLVTFKSYDAPSLDRVDYGVGAGLVRKIGGPDADHAKYEIGMEGKETFADYSEGSREYWKTEVNASFIWNISAKVALVLKTAYVHRDDNTPAGARDYDQWVFSSGVKMTF